MEMPFRTLRDDGRSDRQVIYDLVKDAAPGTIFPFSALADALQVGLPETVTRARIGGAARAASDRLLTDDQRALESVPRTGYRVARADDHALMAQRHHRRARRESSKSLALITNVHEDELSPEMRGLVRDLRVAFGAVAQMIHAAERRTRRVESVLDEVVRVNQDLAARVARLEGQGSAD